MANPCPAHPALSQREAETKSSVWEAARSQAHSLLARQPWLFLAGSAWPLLASKSVMWGRQPGQLGRGQAGQRTTWQEQVQMRHHPLCLLGWRQ